MKIRKQDKLILIIIMIIAITIMCVIFFGDTLLMCKLMGEEYFYIENGVCYSVVE